VSQPREPLWQMSRPRPRDTTASSVDSDLDEILDASRDVLEDLRGSRLFVTGGTGFVGSWLLESFSWANDRLGLDASMTVLSRDPVAFAAREPRLAAHSAIELVHGDVRHPLESLGTFEAAIHAATPASRDLNETAPIDMFETIVEGTARVLATLSASGSIPLLLTSSGAVYGPQPPDLALTPEEFLGGPDPLAPTSAYAEGKRASELLGAVASAAGSIELKLARCFAFVGPRLPLDRHFAIGNFIGDSVAGRPIVVRGDGTAVRSYLYASELTSWLWTILLRGTRGRAYNVGSEHAISVGALAETVASAFTPSPVIERRHTPSPGAAADRYVPSTQRAREELGLNQSVSLTEAIRRTVAWYTER